MRTNRSLEAEVEKKEAELASLDERVESLSQNLRTLSISNIPNRVRNSIAPK